MIHKMQAREKITIILMMSSRNSLLHSVKNEIWRSYQENTYTINYHWNTGMYWGLRVCILQNCLGKSKEEFKRSHIGNTEALLKTVFSKNQITRYIWIVNFWSFEKECLYQKHCKISRSVKKKWYYFLGEIGQVVGWGSNAKLMKVFLRGTIIRKLLAKPKKNFITSFQRKKF